MVEQTHEKIAMQCETGALVALMTIEMLEQQDFTNNLLQLLLQIVETHAQ